MIRRASLLEIRRMVAAEWNITEAQLLGSSRLPRFVRPRQVTFYLARRFTDLTWPELADRLGRDRSTAKHSVAQIANLRSRDRALDMRIAALERRIERRCGFGLSPMAHAGAENRAGPILPLIMPHWHNFGDLSCRF